MNKDSIIDFLGFIIVKSLSLLFCLVPLGLGLWIGRRLGDIVYFLYAKRRRIAYANLKASFPEKEPKELKMIARRHFQNLVMNIIELLKIPCMGKKYFERHVKIENPDIFRQSVDRGKGTIVLTGHFGNWEMASLAVSNIGYTMSVFAREQKYKRLNNLLNSYREMTGCRVIAKGFSVRDIIKTLNNNGIVAMLGDQDAGANGVFIDFLSRPASTAQGPFSFALKTGAAILPSFMRREGYSNHIGRVGEPLALTNTGNEENDIKENMKRVRDIFEDYVRKYPEQWLWCHKRWKSTTERSVLVLSDGKPGHLNQGMAVAGMVGEALCSRLKARGIEEEPIVKVNVVEIEFKNIFTRFILDIATMFTYGCLNLLKLCLKQGSFKEIKNKYADIIVSCGANTVAASVLLKNENNARNIIIMKPGMGRSSKFNLVILARHDEPKVLKSNILITESAPNRILQTCIGGGRNIGLLIGGDAKNFKLTKETVQNVVNEILKIAEQMDRKICVSTSRRTSPEIDNFLKEKLGGNKYCKLLVIANEKNIEGVVPAIFSMSEFILVSPDSISMISEAATSGRHVIVFEEEQQGNDQRKTKYEKTIDNLEGKGYIKTALPGNIHITIKGIIDERPMPKKLDDRPKIVERLKGIV